MTKEKWLVVVDRKYYPSVFSFDTLEEANEVYQEYVETIFSDDAIYITKIIEETVGANHEPLEWHY